MSSSVHQGRLHAIAVAIAVVVVTKFGRRRFLVAAAHQHGGRLSVVRAVRLHDGRVQCLRGQQLLCLEDAAAQNLIQRPKV